MSAYDLFIAEAFRLLVDLGVKGGLLLGLALGVTTLCRRGRPALRHLTWIVAFGALLALPLLQVAVPHWNVPLLVPPGLSADRAVEAPATPTALPPAAIRPGGTGFEGVRRLQRPEFYPSRASAPGGGEALRDVAWEAETGAARPSGDVFAAALVFLWLAGVLLMLGRLLTEVRWAYGLTRAATPVGVPELRVLAPSLLMRPSSVHRVRLRVCRSVTVPMTWGVFRPVILLPGAFYAWSAAQRQAVILHELAHVRRRDYATHLVAYAALALNWFNPLAHLAFRRLHVERERAADNAVLDAGMAPIEYAGQLLAVARDVWRRSEAPDGLVVASMARRGEVRERIEAVLRRNVPRRGLARWEAVTTGAAVLLLALPIVAVSPWCEPALCTSHPEGTQVVAASYVPGAELRARAHAEQFPALRALLQDKNAAVRVSAVASLSDLHGRGVTEALVEALRDEDFEVRAAAASVLGHRRAAAAVPALVEVLGQSVCSYAAEEAARALGLIGSPEAVGPLTEALASDAPYLRRAAARALGRLGDPRARAALDAALCDAVPGVRAAAAEALSALDAPAPPSPRF